MRRQAARWVVPGAIAASTVLLAVNGAVLGQAHVCPGDCNGDGSTTVDELVLHTSVALGLLPLDACTAADTDDNGIVTIDEVVGAVAIALEGCPTSPTGTPTSTVTATATESPTISPTPAIETPSPTETPTVGNTATPSVTPSRGETPTSTPTTTATSPLPTSIPTDTASPAITPAATATPTDTPAEPTVTGTRPPTATPTHTLTATGTATPKRTPTASSTKTATQTETPTRTPTRTSTRTPTASPTRTATSTATPTATTTPTSSPTGTSTVTPTNTLAPGVRRFSLNPTSSGIRTFSNLSPPTNTSGFEGYLDLALGLPDAMGVAQVDIVGSSEFLSLALAAAEGEEPMNFCIHPIDLPVIRAGVVDCDGGEDLGISTFQNHVVGVVGDNGFSAADCEAANGRIETFIEPHPNTCIGPVFVQPSGIDSGAGALLMAPDPRFDTLGLPAEVSVDAGPCAMHQGSERTQFGFVSARYSVEIANPNGIPGSESLVHQEDGENLSCADWDQEDGPGRLILSLGAIHGAGGGLIDVVTVFELDD